MFKKILIANRGEIAVRIERACREMGIRSVAVFSDADRASLHVRLTDEACRIGPAPSRESYLVIEKIIAVAKSAGCDALHPGYGFLAENPALARACSRAGIVFIGPSPEAMERLGSKTAARQLARKVNVPTVPGTLDPIERIEDASSSAQEIGFPIVLKAVAGGGGKGMRLVEKATELAAAWRDASSEATNAFGDGRMYLEKFLLHPRHIEIQLLADQHGHSIYLGERECSVQRRYQKVIEEAPSPIMTPPLRRAMGEAAVKLARAGEYANAGTLEFLVDAGRNFYFLEMNTRLQVEHPVTEMVTSRDLVKLQIAVASGEALPFTQEDVALHGHAIECRIYAEDPDNNFFPSPGKILKRRAPSGPGIRLDDGVYEGWTVPTDYDPMLGKLIAWGATRDEAIARMSRAFDEYYATGIQTNVKLFRRILSEPEFLRGDIHTKWLDELLRRPPNAPSAQTSRETLAEDAAALAAGVWFVNRNRAGETQTQHAQNQLVTLEERRPARTAFHIYGFTMNLKLTVGTRTRSLKINRTEARTEFSLDGRGIAADVVEIEAGIFSVLIGDEAFEVRIEPAASGARVAIDGREYAVQFEDPRRWKRGVGGVGDAEGHQNIVAPMPGKVVRLLVKAGEAVQSGQGLLVLEAMKMQNEIKSSKSGSVERFNVVEGQAVNAGDVVAVIS